MKQLAANQIWRRRKVGRRRKLGEEEKMRKEEVKNTYSGEHSAALNSWIRKKINFVSENPKMMLTKLQML